MWSSKKLRNVGMGFVFFCGSALVGCFSQDAAKDPKQTLTQYISRSFSVHDVEDREGLLKFMTGDVKSRLESWSEDQFRAAFIDVKRELIKLSFREVKEISDKEVEIVYELSYLDQGKGRDHSHSAKVTNRKLCQVVLQQGKWLISDVRNIKEVLEYKNELSLP